MKKIRNIFLAFMLGIVSIQCIWANAMDSDECRLVRLVRHVGNLDEVQSLINKGVDINAECYGSNALIRAIWAKNLKVLKYLISKGANINKVDNEGNTALILAAEYGKLEAVKVLVESGANVNLRNNSGYTALEISKENEIWDYLKPRTRDFNAGLALIRAARVGNMEQVKYYLSQGVDINTKDNEGNTALIESTDNLEVLKYLVKKGADLNAQTNEGRTVLSYAVCRNLDMVKALVEGNKKFIFFKSNRIDVNKDSNMLFRFNRCTSAKLRAGAQQPFYDHYEILKYLIDNGLNINVENKHGKSFFVDFISYDPKYIDLEQVEYLVSKGKVDLKKYGEEALFASALTNRLDIVEYLISQGVNINAFNSDVYANGWLCSSGDKSHIIYCPKYTNSTALSIFSSNGNLEAVKYLISKGFNLKKYGEDSLAMASMYGRLNIVKYLMSQGVTPNARSIRLGGNTALSLAAYYNHFEVVKYLVAQGADDIVMWPTISSLIWAIEGNNLEIVRFLVENGADVNDKYTPFKPLSYAKSDEMRQYLINVGAKY